MLLQSLNTLRIEALTAAKDAPKMMRHQYKKRRDYVYNRLTQMGLTVEKPTGAFYLFPYVGHLTSSSFDFALDLVKAGLAVVPGTAFSEYGESTFACPMRIVSKL